jgi:hypothetical protein
MAPRPEIRRHRTSRWNASGHARDIRSQLQIAKLRYSGGSDGTESSSPRVVLTGSLQDFKDTLDRAAGPLERHLAGPS